MKKTKLFCAALSAAFLLFTFNACEKNTAPEKLIRLKPDTTTGTNDNVKRDYSLHVAPLPAGTVSGKMVLIPVFDSTFVDDSGKTCHVASGFVDGAGDTAFVTESFYMDTAEVTKAEWMATMADSSDSIPANFPKTRITWFDAVRYCVRRTAAEALSQVYDTAGWNPSQGVGPVVNWSATGYRLPTEDEWEYAAKGGVRNRVYATSTGEFLPTLLNNGYVDRLDTSTLVFDYNDKLDLYSATINVRFTKDSIRGISRYIRTEGTHDSMIIASSYDSTKSVWRNSLSKYYRFHVVFNSTVSYDTNQKVFHDSVIVVSDSIFKLNVNTILHYTIKDYRYMYEVSGSNVVDTLTIRIQYHDSSFISDDVDPNERFPGPTRTLFNDILTVSDTNRIATDTVNTALQRIVNKRKTLRPFTKDSTSFIQVRTQEVTLYCYDSLEFLGLTDKSTFSPNIFLLRDMSGNVAEWCNDGFASANRGYRVNFRPEGNCATYVCRGGHAACNDEFRAEPSTTVKTGTRHYKNPHLRSANTGFRCVRIAP